MKKILIVLGLGMIIFLGLLNRQYNIIAEKNRIEAIEQHQLLEKCQEQSKMKIDSLNAIIRVQRALADSAAILAAREHSLLIDCQRKRKVTAINEIVLLLTK